MKKTLLATAIAGAAFASAGAQAATIYNEDGTKLDLYGNIQIAYYDVNDAAGDSKDTLTDNGSTVGFAGEHLITRDLKGYFKAEFEHDADEAKTAGGLDTGDQAYTGLKGNFGDVRVGSWDPLIDDWIQDPISNNESFDVKDSTQNIIGLSDREGNKVSYTSPSFSGFQFAVGTQFEGDAESFNPDVDTNVAGLTGKTGSSTGVQKTSDSNASFFGGAKYTAGAFSIAAVYDNLDNYDGSYTGYEDDGDGQKVTRDNDAGDQYGITAEYTVDTLRLALKLERFQAGDDLIEDVNYYGFGARYGYGMGDIYGSYQYVDVGGDSFLDTAKDGLGHNEFPNDGGESYNEVVLGATYNISDAMYTFIEGGMYDRKDDVDDGVAVGAVYLF